MPLAKTVNYGFTHRLEIGIPSHMKEKDPINEFKYAVKTWKPDLCLCRLCKVSLQNIAYLNSGEKIVYMFRKIRISQLFFRNNPALCIYFSLYSNLFEFMEFI